MKSLSLRIATILSSLTILLIGTTTLAFGGVAELSQRLAQLRSGVERLSGEVEDKKADIDARMSSLRNQKGDAEVQLKREEARLRQLERSLEKRRQAIDARDAGREELEPAVRTAIAKMRESVRTSLPFKRGERLGELDSLKEKLDEGLISPPKAASRLWQFVEDELRLSRENGLYRQVVQVDGEEVLTDVARVGMIAVYYKTEDGRVGMARHGDDGWSWTELTSEDDVERVRELFDAFKKNIRVGHFELPNAVSTGAQ